MALRGRIDGVFEGMLRGWLWDPDRPSLRLIAELSLDGAPLARVRADQPRADLEAIGFGEGGGGFAVPVPIRAQDGALHEVLLVAEHSWMSLEVDRLRLPIPPRLHMLRGRLEGVRNRRCLGWVWDGARPDERIRVALVHAGQVLARQVAELRRSGLRQAGIGDGAHGFAFDLGSLRPAPEAGALLELRCQGGADDDMDGWLIGTLTMPAGLVLPAPAAPGPAKGLSRRQALAAARKAEAERDHALAARLLDAALLDSPGDADLLSIRARIHLAQQELEPAEQLARSVLRQQLGHPRASLMLARALSGLGRHAEAVTAWEAIGPADPGFGERVTKRMRSLTSLGRQAEAQHEAAMALRAHPDDAEMRRHLAQSAEAAGALGAARAHWRHLLARLPDDPMGQERLRALEDRAGTPAVPGLASPLAHPEIRDWRAPLELRIGPAPLSPAAGLSLNARAGHVLASPADPRQHWPGELPGYGLRLRAEGGGADIAFQLAAAAAMGGWRMGLELAGSAGIGVSVHLRRLGDDPEERPVARLALETRSRLHRFDLVLTETEGEALNAQGMALVLRLEGPGLLKLQPPRALSRLRPVPAPAGGFETPDLPLPLPPAEERRAETLADLGSAFTSIAIIAPTEALEATLRGVLSGTAAPFECVLNLRPGWPEALIAALRALAARDPRFRLRPQDAPAATGWVALLAAPPSGGPGWLTALHRQAAIHGRAEAPGVVLERRG